MQDKVANILPVDPDPRDPGVGSKGQNSIISEWRHLAYQIKGNDTGSNMVANILLPDPPPPQKKNVRDQLC